MLTYVLTCSTVPPNERFVRVEMMLIPPDDFSTWSETDRDRYMLDQAGDALARQLGRASRPAYINFDYFEVRDSAWVGPASDPALARD